MDQKLSVTQKTLQFQYLLTVSQIKQWATSAPRAASKRFLPGKQDAFTTINNGGSPRVPPLDCPVF